ncbi:hypothetical protein SNEBB_007345 [Seison nebaliae]|nr:hypothetical protein SNEBB_007345 [Seison nebaliae]
MKLLHRRSTATSYVSPQKNSTCKQTPPSIISNNSNSSLTSSNKRVTKKSVKKPKCNVEISDETNSTITDYSFVVNSPYPYKDDDVYSQRDYLNNCRYFAHNFNNLNFGFYPYYQDPTASKTLSKIDDPLNYNRDPYGLYKEMNYSMNIVNKLMN